MRPCVCSCVVRMCVRLRRISGRLVRMYVRACAMCVCTDRNIPTQIPTQIDTYPHRLTWMVMLHGMG